MHNSPLAHMPEGKPATEYVDRERGRRDRLTCAAVTTAVSTRDSRGRPASCFFPGSIQASTSTKPCCRRELKDGRGRGRRTGSW